jgi:hypothetical protein
MLIAALTQNPSKYSWQLVLIAFSFRFSSRPLRTFFAPFAVKSSSRG